MESTTLAALNLDDITIAILDSMPFGIYYCDKNLVVQYINEPYAEYLRVPRTKVLGRKITEFIPKTRSRFVMQSGKEEMYDALPSRNDKSRQCVFNRVPIRNAGGEMVGFVSQLISVGDQGWTDIWGRMEQAKTLAQSSLSRPADPDEVRKKLRENIIGESAPLRQCVEQALLFGDTQEVVHIFGPTGVGKEIFAQAIHQASSRAHGPFVAINCAAISKEFIASELFGYAPGAFTGAQRQGKPGQIELADKGTLFLDEIGDMPLATQSVLLRVLETRQVQRLNGVSSRLVDFRLLSATNVDLNQKVKDGSFREDLYYRITALTLQIPSLAERREDIPLLVQHFLHQGSTSSPSISPEAMSILCRHQWPGNVRELRNALIYASVKARYDVILPEHLNPDMVRLMLQRPQGRTSQECGSAPPMQEKDWIAHTLQRFAGNVSAAAKELCMSRTTLYKKIRQYQLSV